jgi:hypothetical protein
MGNYFNRSQTMSMFTHSRAVNKSLMQCAAYLGLACLMASTAGAVDTLEIARAYDDGGGYDNTWKGSGVPQEIRFQNERILAKGKGTYCCGFTFAVVMKAAHERGLLQGKSAEEVRAFQKQWYGATEESREIQCALAVQMLGIGQRVESEDARPGDFLQFWRTNKSGHSVVFLGWVMDGGQRVGFKYRSSQGSTKGIGDRVEYFSTPAGKEGQVVRERMYFSRLDEKGR